MTLNYKRPRKRALQSALVGAAAASLIGSSLVLSPAQAAEQGYRNFSVTAQKTQGVPGQYMVAQSDDGYVWVTGSSGRPPIETATIAKVDPATMKIVATAQLQTVPFKDRDTGEVIGKQIAGPYGIDVDDTNKTVWVTNTRTNAISVYSQKNMELLWTNFDENATEAAIAHPREVVVDEKHGVAFVGSQDSIHVYDLKTFEEKEAINSPGENEGRQAKMNMALDEASNRLFVPDLAGNFVEVINTETRQVVQTFPLTIPDADAKLSASDVAFDASENELYVTSQGADGKNSGVSIYDASTGEFKKFIAMGSQALSVDNDEERDLVYVTDFSTGKVFVVDGRTDNLVSTVNVSERAVNDVEVLNDGSVFAVDKATYASPVEVPFTIEFASGAYRTASQEQKGATAEMTDIAANSFTKINVADAKAKSSIDPKTTTSDVVKGATVTGATVIEEGAAIQLSGTGWKHPDGSGSIAAVLYDKGTTQVNGERVVSYIEADAEGNWTATVPFPAASNVSSGKAWAAGEEHAITFLSGSSKDGDESRSITLKVNVVAAAAESNLSPEAPEVTSVDPAAIDFQGWGQVIDVLNPPVVPEPTDDPTADPTKPADPADDPSKPSTDPTDDPSVEPSDDPSKGGTEESSDPSASEFVYENCDAAWLANGKQPIKKGEYGYGAKLDRDGDGVACEVDDDKEAFVNGGSGNGSDSGSNNSSQSGTGNLAYTGASIATAAGLGVLALGAGIFFVVARRRKSA